MSYNISKELLSEVLGQHITNCRPSGKWVIFNELLGENEFGYSDINIYELAHKCKEWALKQGYILHSSIDEIGEGYLKVDHFTEELYGERVRTFKTSSEQQAVFDGCQWILDIKESELTNNEDFVTKLSGALFQIANLRIKNKQ